MTTTETSSAGGRQKLMEAALRLASRKSSVASLGLRELAREAGLNPNTFYRHFRDLDELSAAIVEDFGQQVRSGRNQAWRDSHDFSSFLAVSVERYFVLVTQHPDAFILGFRELGRGSPASRAVRKLIEELTLELVQIAKHFAAFPQLDDAALIELASYIIAGLSALSIECIETQAKHGVAVAKAKRFVALLLRGVAASESATKPVVPERAPARHRTRAPTKQRG